MTTKGPLHPNWNFDFFSQIFCLLKFSDVWFNLTSHGFNLILRKIIHRVSHGNHLANRVTDVIIQSLIFQFLWRTSVHFVLPLVPIFLTYAMGFKPIVHHLICVLLHLHAMDSLDSLLKEHLANLLVAWLANSMMNKKYLQLLQYYNSSVINSFDE